MFNLQQMAKKEHLNANYPKELLRAISMELDKEYMSVGYIKEKTDALVRFLEQLDNKTPF